MGDDIGLDCVCFDFCHSVAEHVIYVRKTDIDDSLSLNPNRCQHPLFTQLSLDNFFPC